MMLPSTNDAGVLLVGHGTRSALGQKQFLLLAEQLRHKLDLAVEPAFLEMAEPTIEQGIGRLIRGGMERLIVAPLLLFAAGHAKEDVPAAVGRALSRFGAANLPRHQTRPFGYHPRIVELAHQRLVEATKELLPVPAERILLISVGRGSTDDQATAEMHTFARLLAERAGMINRQVAFLAMARPLVADVLPAVAKDSFSRVIVQPHLLFHGELVERLRRQIDEIAAGHPGQEWIVGRLLADDDPAEGNSDGQLADATASLIEQALQR